MRRFLLSACSFAIMGLAHAARAEEGAGASPSLDDQSSAVEAVIITGEKASRSLQQTVTSVAVTTAARIERENIQTFYDVVARTANMSETYGKTGFTIRGVSNMNVSGGGTGGLATVYVDGAALPIEAVYGGPLEMWDIGQVEVLRGPQSTLQGRNSLAGAVIITSANPTYTPQFRARINLASGDERTFALATGGPIVTDQLAFRAAVEKKDSDGFVYNPTLKRDTDALDSLTLRGKLLFTPTALPGLRATLTYAHSDRDAGYQFTYARIDTPDYYKHRVDLSGEPNRTKTKTDVITADVAYKFSEALTLNAIASLNTVETDATYDMDFTPVRTSYGARRQDTDTASQELRLNYEGERLRGLVGLYHARRDAQDKSTSQVNVDFPRATLVNVLSATLLAGAPSPTPAQQAAAAAQANAFANLYIAALPVIPVDYSGDQPSVIDTSAIFADASVALTEKLSLLGGFRYDHEKNTSSSGQVARFTGAYPTASAFGAYGPYVTLVNAFVANMVAQASSSAPKDTRTFNAFLPKVGLKYDWTPDINTSLVAQRGYRSGGSTVNIARSTVAAYDPEYTWNYEAALRTAWLDGALTLNANAFYVDWKDQQVTVNLGLNSYDYEVRNAGKSHLYGFELEVAQRVNPALSWYASLGHTKTKFDDFKITSGVDTRNLAGSQFPYAPRWTVAMGADYRWTNGLIAHLDGNYRSRSYSSAGLQQAQDDVVKERVVFNGRFGYERAHWGAYVYGKNLLNATYAQYTRADVGVAMLSEPRILGLTVETRW
ncbi:TonB-dependent receptor [Caulobacter vibrioides]|uniref:TonB-dependent receptor n=1 Tax=Caulobacter vibrioides TaxID=155892 RepID=A0A290MX61_CAUVI|nr:TonB-dependent receptor [Caulobacter vibrioides]ATC34494.1 TonB-dependent receptor [Caulobacter vibrioides]